MNYDGTTYYYILNLQGDVIAIVDGSGNIQTEYEYNAWGELVQINGEAEIGSINPIRYRGYYYDAETGFYYVSSRYYDPEVGRWLNADGYITTGQGVLSYNMFAYCGNNPVNRTDPTGMKWWDSFKSTVKNAWNKVKTWVSKTLGISSKKTTTAQVINKGSLIKVKSGVKTTTTVNKKKKPYVPVTIYSSTENNLSEYKTTIGGGIKNEWNNTDFNIGTGGMSYSQSFEFLLSETSMTYSITDDGDVEYEASGSICWDNTEFTAYISVSSRWQIAAAAGAFAVGKSAAIPVIIPLLSGVKY